MGCIRMNWLNKMIIVANAACDCIELWKWNEGDGCRMSIEHSMQRSHLCGATRQLGAACILNFCVSEEGT